MVLFMGAFENSFHVYNFFPFSATVHARSFFFCSPLILASFGRFCVQAVPPFMPNDQLQFTFFFPSTYGQDEGTL